MEVVFVLFVVIIVPMFLIVLLVKGVQGAGKAASRTDLQKLLDAETARSGFTPTRTLVQATGLLSFDMSANRFFIASNGPSARILGVYPIDSLLRYDNGHDFIGQHVKYYIDLTVSDLNNPRHRIWFGNNEQSRSEWAAVIEAVWASPRPTAPA